MRAAESIVVAALLVVVASATGAGSVQWVSASAVWVTFLYVQEASSAAEAADRAQPEAGASDRLAGLLIVKEALWAVAFVVTGAWPALFGCALFMSYPAWRRSRIA